VPTATKNTPPATKGVEFIRNSCPKKKATNRKSLNRNNDLKKNDLGIQQSLFRLTSQHIPNKVTIINLMPKLLQEIAKQTHHWRE